MLFDKGKLEKLTLRVIQESKDGKRKVLDDDKHTYVLQVNPSTYTLNHLLEHSYSRGMGIGGKQPMYANSPPINLSFEFLFDGTGVVPAPSELGDIPLVGAIASALSKTEKFDVMEQINSFKKVVYDCDGKVHEPRTLLMVWGTLVLPCVLSSVSFRFTLFRPDGTPLRAIASCTFCESLSKTEEAAKKNNTSPDLTHLRDVREGDNLPAMADDIYGNPELYLQVARANKLVNFRKLRPTSRVSFPPLVTEKT